MKNYFKKVQEEEKNQIAIDFDGVIHKNSKGFYDGTIYDEPVEGSLNAIKTLAKEYKIVIFTCKAKEDRVLVNNKTGKELISDWLDLHGFSKYISEITAEKPRAKFYIDDKCYRFIDWKDMMSKL